MSGNDFRHTVSLLTGSSHWGTLHCAKPVVPLPSCLGSALVEPCSPPVGEPRSAFECAPAGLRAALSQELVDGAPWKARFAGLIIERRLAVRLVALSEHASAGYHMRSSRLLDGSRHSCGLAGLTVLIFGPGIALATVILQPSHQGVFAYPPV